MLRIRVILLEQVSGDDQSLKFASSFLLLGLFGLFLDGQLGEGLLVTFV